MTDPATAREALIVEALGEADQLLRQVQALVPLLEQACHVVRQADERLQSDLAGFEARIGQLTEVARHQAALHIARRADEAARQTIEQQGRAMATAARAAFEAELGPTLQQLSSARLSLAEAARPQWETLLTHLAVAVAASAATWLIALHLRGN